MPSVTGCNRVPAPPANTMPFKVMSQRMHGRDRDGHVIKNSGHCCPERQRWQLLRIERHHDGIARPDPLAGASRLEPTMAFSGDYAAVGVNYIDFAAIRPSSRATAQGYVVI